MRTFLISISFFALSPLAHAQPPSDHPAVAVQRLNAQRGYDYASKFYPHPAWLYLQATPSDDAAPAQRVNADAAVGLDGAKALRPTASKTAGERSNSAPRAQVRASHDR